jgi:hypothetical protein
MLALEPAAPAWARRHRCAGREFVVVSAKTAIANDPNEDRSNCN